jgi:hypothetical protein
LSNANKYGIEVNINCVINKLNADHLDENIRYWIDEHPYIRHFVWNNLDPSMGRAEVNQAEYTPRLADFEVSLQKAMRLLHAVGPHLPRREGPALLHDGVRVGEHRDPQDRQGRGAHRPLPRQQADGPTDGLGAHLLPSCEVCSLRTICGGLFDRGNAYDPAELYPVFVSRDAIVEAIIKDPRDPSYEFRTLADWQRDFDKRIAETIEARNAREAKLRAEGHRDEHSARADLNGMQVNDGPAVGMVTDQGLRLFEAKRRSEGKKAAELGVSMEKTDVALPKGE